MRVAFISDLFLSDGIVGGAELVNDCLIMHLRERGHEVQPIHSHAKIDFSLYEFFIISNFINMPDNVKEALYDKRYIIYEHDHKYLRNRNPSSFPDFRAPPHMIINEKFYRCAKAVFCQSKIHAEVIKKNLAIRNVINTGCSLWHSEQLNVLRKHCDNEKNNLYAILDSSNPIKGTSEAENYCLQNNMPYEKIPFSEFDKFAETLSSYSGLVFFPKTLETFCRVVAEARMLNCKLITNGLNGCASEDWFPEYRGSSLISFVESRQKEIVDKVCNIMSQKVINVEPEDITVILNCYRRPYNLQMQVDSIRSQTKPPKEIWLWVNHHPDNEGFSFDSLGIDKVFHNDYNWKFYGRFAGALLADTEYVAIFDDDTIPGSKWFENCLDTMQEKEGIMGSAGYVQEGKLATQYYREGWPSKNVETKRVDYVGHAWFFKRDWLQYLWREKPPTWDNGEDMHFSYSVQKYAGLQTYCPPHPPEDMEMHGSLYGYELGVDEKATSNNQAVSHQTFFSQRDMCVNYGLENGWKTVKGVEDDLE